MLKVCISWREPFHKAINSQVRIEDYGATRLLATTEHGVQESRRIMIQARTWIHVGNGSAQIRIRLCKPTILDAEGIASSELISWPHEITAQATPFAPSQGSSSNNRQGHEHVIHRDIFLWMMRAQCMYCITREYQMWPGGHGANSGLQFSLHEKNSHHTKECFLLVIANLTSQGH